MAGIVVAILWLVYGALLTSSHASFTDSRTISAGTFQAAAAFDTHQQAVTANSPSAYWRLNENTAASSADLGSANATGTWSGGVTGQVAGALTDPDTAARFDGTGLVTAGSNAMTLTGTSAWTIEAWGRPTLDDNYGRHIFRCQNGTTLVALYHGGGGYVIDRWVNGNQVGMGPHNNGTATLNNWTYVVATFDGSNIRLYINGTLKETLADPDSAGATTCAPVLGGYSTQPATEYWIGDIDDVAMYTTALTQTKINTHYTARTAAAPTYKNAVLADSPRVYWRLNDTAGAALDSSGNNRTASPSSTTGMAKVAGALTGGDSARDFTASTYLTTTATFTYTGTQNFTVEAWIKPSLVDTSSRTIARCVAGTAGWHIFANSTAGLSATRYSGGTTATTPNTTAPPTASWTHVAVTYDGATLQLYRNGTLAASVATALSLPATVCTMTLAGSSATTAWRGTLDEVAIYPTALSANAVMILYQRRA